MELKAFEIKELVDYILVAMINHNNIRPDYKGAWDGAILRRSEITSLDHCMNIVHTKMLRSMLTDEEFSYFQTALEIERIRQKSLVEV